jgi:hypothetical protein
MQWWETIGLITAVITFPGGVYQTYQIYKKYFASDSGSDLTAPADSRSISVLDTGHAEVDAIMQRLPGELRINVLFNPHRMRSHYLSLSLIGFAVSGLMFGVALLFASAAAFSSLRGTFPGDRREAAMIVAGAFGLGFFIGLTVLRETLFCWRAAKIARYFSRLLDERGLHARIRLVPR